jgi:hypothetical protein
MSNNDTTSATGGTTVTAAIAVGNVDLVSSIVSRYNLAVGSSRSSGNSGGEAGIQRLLYIANKHPNPSVQVASFRAISTTCLRNGNFQRYKELFAASASGGQQQQQVQQDANNYDAAWVAEQEALYRQGRDVLQHRLQAAQSQLHKVRSISQVHVCCL